MTRPFAPVQRAGERYQPAELRAMPATASPLAAWVLRCLVALVVCAIAWMVFGQLDIVAVADGRLVPRVTLHVVQAAEAGIVREILVTEGATVLPGQVLIRLDAAVAEAETRALAHELALRLLQLRRIDAELAELPLARVAGDGDEPFQRALQQYRANRSAYLDAVAQESAQRLRVAQDLRAANAVAVKLERTLPIYRTMADRFERLQREGFVSELAALEREREHIEKQQDQRAQEHTVASLQASLTQADRRLAQVTSGYRAQLHAERAQAEAQRSRVAEDLAKQLARAQSIELRAPEAGIVKELATKTRGAVVGAGTVLLTLVPIGEELQADVVVRNADIGFVHPGQRARVKLVSYPFQKYGLIEGSVVHVSADASDTTAPRRDPAGLSMPAAGELAGYRARVALAGQALPFGDVSLPLAAGMLVATEIHLGERTLLEYLLAPVRRAWHEAARER